MTSTTSRWPAVVDALITTFGAVANLKTFDGCEFELSGDDGDFVIVGGDIDADVTPGGIGQAWVGIGRHSRDEEGQVACAIVVQTGDSIIKPSRDRAFAVLGALEAAVVADPTLGGVIETGWLMPLNAQPTQWQTDDGSFCRLPFVITYKARLTP